MSEAKNEQPELPQVVRDAEARTATYAERITQALEGTFGGTQLTLQRREGKPEIVRYVGKVRDRYDNGEEVVLVATDRLSAFDRQLAEIPFKGSVLNLTTRWWLERTQHVVDNYLFHGGPRSGASLHPNVIVGRKCTPFPIEFVMRAYLTGSSGTAIWTHYNKGVRSYCGHSLPEGMVKNERLPANLLTPTTKSDEHDELISAEELVKQGYMTQEDWDFCAAKAHALFEFGQKTALEHGLILVDTKYEFGRDAETGKILLIDEIHTPDSSRYWIAATYEDCMQRGSVPQNIDKEFVRLWFKERCDPYADATLPEAPADLRAELSRRYIMLYELITGETFQFPEIGADPNAAIQSALAAAGL